MENYVTCTENMFFFFCLTCKSMCKRWILHIGKGCTLVEWSYTSLGVNMKWIMSDIPIGIIKRNIQLYIYIKHILLRYAAYKYIVYIYKIYYGLLTFWHRGKLRRRYFLWSPYLDSLWGSNPNPTPNPHLSNVSYLAYVRSWGSIWVSILLDLSTFLLCPSSPPWELFFLSWTWGLWNILLLFPSLCFHSVFFPLSLLVLLCSCCPAEPSDHYYFFFSLL